MYNNTARLFKSACRPLAVLLLLTGWLVATCPLAAAPDLQLANSIYNHGLAHYADGDYQGAIDYLGQIVQMMPEHDQARYYLAYSYSLAGHQDKALEHARILAARYPGHQLYVQLIEVFMQLKLANSQTSVSDNDHSQSLSQPGYDVYSPPAVKPREIRKKSVVKKDKSQTERISDMIEEERYAEASDELQKLLAADAKNAEARYYLGMLHFNQARYVEAVEQYEESLKIRPGNFDTYFFAGSCYLNQQILDKAETNFDLALKIKEDTFTRINLADIYMRTSRLADSEKMYQTVIRSNPDYTEAKVGLALVKLAQGFVEEAAEMVNKVLSDNPANARARYARSQILMENRLYSEALEEARAAYDNSPGNAEYRVNYALAMLRNFQVEAGMQEAQEVLNSWPDFVEAKLVLAEGLIMAGNTAAAAGHIEAAAASRHIPQIDYLRATLAASAGDPDQAKAHWLKYLEGAASLPSAHVKYAVFLESIADNAGALIAYQKVVEKFPDTAAAASVQADIARLSQPEATSAVPPRPPIPGL